MKFFFNAGIEGGEIMVKIIENMINRKERERH